MRALRPDGRDEPSDTEEWDARDVLRWGIQRFGRRLAIVTSFQIEGMVILDLACQIDPSVRVVTVDTGRLPEETYAVMDQVCRRYGVSIEVYSPDADELRTFVHSAGINAFYRSVESRQQCCNVRKVRPLTRVLALLDAWVSGLRKEQAPTRQYIRKVERDGTHGDMVKLNPLADWSEEQVWAYGRLNEVPYNELYNRGYRSIGCAPCSRPARMGTEPRSDRWWWEQDAVKECGMHSRVQTTGNSEMEIVS